MDENQKRRIFQYVKTLTLKKFWQWMNEVHTRAYAMRMNHIQEAMECHPRISKPMVEQVLRKAEEIREQWDGLKTVTVEDTESAAFRTSTEIIKDLTPTEAAIYNLTEEAVISISDRKFIVRPAPAEGAADHGKAKKGDWEWQQV